MKIKYHLLKIFWVQLNWKSNNNKNNPPHFRPKQLLLKASSYHSIGNYGPKEKLEYKAYNITKQVGKASNIKEKDNNNKKNQEKKYTNKIEKEEINEIRISDSK